MSAKEALRAFCEDKVLFGGVWGHRSQISVSCKMLQGTCAALWMRKSLVRWRIGPLDPSPSAAWTCSILRDRSSNRLRIQVGWSP